MTVAVLVLAAVGLTTGGYLLGSSRRTPRRPIGERLAPYARTPIADQVERWLAQRRD